MKTAYAMPCSTPEQAEEMRKLCEKHGIEITQTINDDFHDRHITNYQNGIKGKVGFINGASKGNCGATLIPYNPALFLYSLGVFPEKWCVRDTKESTMFLRKLCVENGWYENDYLNTYNYEDGIYYLDSENNIQWTNNSIPTDYIEVTLEDLIKHYEGKQSTEQPKWEDRTRGGRAFNIIREDRGDGKMIIEVFNEDNVWVATYNNQNGKSTYKDEFDLIPFNPRKTELLAEKEKLQKRVAEIDKELN